jgi:hypothetical protein
MLRIINLLSFVAVLLVAGERVYGDELSDRRAFWERSTFWCMATTPSFPSKEVLGVPTDCDDGDMTMFNGLLCSAGIDAGCDAVVRAQGADGRWWRSPRRIGWEAPDHDVSFSPDQSLGILLYVVKKNDAANVKRWLSWLETNRPCIAELGDRCVQRGWLRFCRDDQEDKRCTLRPADCVRIEMVAQKLGVDGQVCRRVMRELGLPEDVLLPVDEFLRASAVVNEPGYPMHLVSVGILLARQSGMQTEKLNQAAGILAAREPGNPFFQFLHSGATPTVRAALLSICPAPDRPSAYRFQWVWERVPKAESWRESMYWECLFLHDLMYPSG